MPGIERLVRPRVLELVLHIEQAKQWPVHVDFKLPCSCNRDLTDDNSPIDQKILDHLVAVSQVIH